jgi:FeS assembly SUF system protein
VSEDAPFPPPIPHPTDKAAMKPESKPVPDAGPVADSKGSDAPAGGLGNPAPDLKEEVIEVLQSCFDPEIPVNIYDLGLIYDVAVSPENAVDIRMTLTSPACPVAGTLPPEVEQKVRAIPGVGAVKVDLVWEPPWGKHLLSESARLQLGMD